MNNSETISVIHVKPGDCVVFEVGVGNLPLSRVKEFILGIKDSVKDIFPPDVNVLYIPKTSGSTQINVLSFER